MDGPDGPDGPDPWPDPWPDRIQEDKEKQRGKGRIRRFLEDVAEAYSHTDIEFTPGMSFREFE